MLYILNLAIRIYIILIYGWMSEVSGF